MAANDRRYTVPLQHAKDFADETGKFEQIDDDLNYSDSTSISPEKLVKNLSQNLPQGPSRLT